MTRSRSPPAGLHERLLFAISGQPPRLIDRALVLNSNWPRHGLSAAFATLVRSVASWDG
jgi:hypothetical protein